MSTRKTIILAGFIYLLALFAAPGYAADNSCLNCHEKLTAFNEKEKELNDIRIKHLQRDVACSLNVTPLLLIKSQKAIMSSGQIQNMHCSISHATIVMAVIPVQM